VKRPQARELWVIFAAFSNDSCPSCLTETVQFRFLCAKFSSGVTLKELRSIACIISSVSNLKPPSRDIKRSRGRLVRWFIDYWPIVYPWLAVTNLRDADDRSIDGSREFFESFQF
jgi:hypothetical protein